MIQFTRHNPNEPRTHEPAPKLPAGTRLANVDDPRDLTRSWPLLVKVAPGEFVTYQITDVDAEARCRRLGVVAL